MRNYMLGLLSGLAGALLYVKIPGLAWYLWALFVVSTVLIVFSFDVFFGSREEHQPRAAWMGLLLFGGPGIVLQAVVWTLGA